MILAGNERASGAFWSGTIHPDGILERRNRSSDRETYLRE